MNTKKLCVFCALLIITVSTTLADDLEIERPLSYSLHESINFSEHVELISLANVGDIFTIGQDVQSVTAIRSVNHYYMNAYETTYALWYYVKDIAEHVLGYTFQNPGQEGASGKRGQAPTENGYFQPVSSISWRDAIIWCNAFSQVMDKNPCYTYNGEVLKDATDAARIDLAQCDFNANGYRLPSETEWEYAARKIKGEAGNQSFMSGANVSGAAWDFTTIFDAHEQSLEDAAMHNAPIFQIGTANVATANSILGPLSHPKSGQANSLGLYDMSGNILEFCWDWFSEYEPIINESFFGTERVLRGGSWSEYASFLYAADRYAYDPGEAYNYMGFRFCSTSF